jgi:hypothetical protein
MARAKIANNGAEVILRINFTEAAALHALIARVGEDTNKLVCDHTMDTFGALDDIRFKLDAQKLWPEAFAQFGRRASELVDPQADWED